MREPSPFKTNCSKKLLKIFRVKDIQKIVLMNQGHRFILVLLQSLVHTRPLQLLEVPKAMNDSKAKKIYGERLPNDPTTPKQG